MTRCWTLNVPPKEHAFPLEITRFIKIGVTAKGTAEAHQRNIGSTQTMNDIRMIKNEKEYKGPSDGSASADSDDDDEGWMDPLETQELYERMKRNEGHV